MKNPIKLDISKEKRQYRDFGLAFFIIACSVFLVRILGIILGRAAQISTPAASIAIQVVFSIFVQIGILFLFLILFYKLRLKYNAKEIAKISSVKKTRWYNYIFAVLVGFFGIFAVLGTASGASTVLGLMGFRGAAPIGFLPESFSAGFFILNIFLVAVLTSVCEEFAFRGGLYTTLERRHKRVMLYFLMAISFGLFHQNIQQFFHTAVLALILVFVLRQTGSIFPVIIVHFINNFFSVYLNFATRYNLWLGDLFPRINAGLNTNPALVISLFIISLLAFFGILTALYFANRKYTKPKQWVITKEEVIQKEFKPKAKDNAFFISALAICAVATLLTLILGFV